MKENEWKEGNGRRETEGGEWKEGNGRRGMEGCEDGKEEKR